MQLLESFMVGGSLDDVIITLRDAAGKTQRVVIALTAVPCDMPQACPMNHLFTHLFVGLVDVLLWVLLDHLSGYIYIVLPSGALLQHCERRQLVLQMSESARRAQSIDGDSRAT